MYTKETYLNLFTGAPWTNYYKNGKLIATRSKGKLEMKPQSGPAFDPLTRAQGFRYWQKHFPGLPCWMLPPMLEEAIDLKATYRGEYIDRNGERVGVFG